MDYSLTGNLLHEILGMVLLLGFIIHVTINHKYYKVMLKVKKIDKGNTKQITALIINCMLLIITPVMIVSSIIISKDIISFINLGIGQNRMWRMK